MVKKGKQLIKIVETPRDAFQGIKQFIPTDQKISIINTLLKAGFDTVEVGSFVSGDIIPQMADTSDVLSGLNFTEKRSRIMVLGQDSITAGVVSYTVWYSPSKSRISTLTIELGL